MTHAFEAKHFYRFDDGVRPEVFSSMGRRAQALRSSDAKSFLKISHWKHPFVASKAKARQYIVSTTHS